MKDSIIETATDSDTYEIESNTETDVEDVESSEHESYLGKHPDEELKYEEYEEE
jgi:hypothetical protein